MVSDTELFPGNVEITDVVDDVGECAARIVKVTASGRSSLERRNESGNCNVQLVESVANAVKDYVKQLVERVPRLRDADQSRLELWVKVKLAEVTQEINQIHSVSDNALVCRHDLEAVVVDGLPCPGDNVPERS